MPLKTIEESVDVISDFFGGEKAPRGTVDHSGLRLAIQAILVRANDTYVAPTAEYGTGNVVSITDYKEEEGAEVVPTLVGTGVVKDPNTGLFDNTATGSQFQIVSGPEEFFRVDANSGKLIVSGNIESDIVDHSIVIRMTNGYFETIEVPVTISVTLAS
jgi:hypothetical protein